MVAAAAAASRQTQRTCSGKKNIKKKPNKKPLQNTYVPGTRVCARTIYIFHPLYEGITQLVSTCSIVMRNNVKNEVLYYLYDTTILRVPQPFCPSRGIRNL